MTTSALLAASPTAVSGSFSKIFRSPNPGGHYLRAALASDQGIAATGRRCEWAAEVGKWRKVSVLMLQYSGGPRVGVAVVLRGGGWLLTLSR
jgi:hypothetical protein